MPGLSVSSRYAGWHTSSGVGVVLAVALASAAAAAPAPPLTGVAPLIGVPLMEEFQAEADADAEADAVAGCAPSHAQGSVMQAHSSVKHLLQLNLISGTCHNPAHGYWHRSASKDPARVSMERCCMPELALSFTGLHTAVPCLGSCAAC